MQNITRINVIFKAREKEAQYSSKGEKLEKCFGFCYSQMISKGLVPSD